MNQSEENRPQQESTERVFTRKDTALVERLLWGSTEDFSGEGVIGLSWLIYKNSHKDKLDPDLFRIPNVDPSRPESLAKVNELRQGQRYTKKGIMPFIDFTTLNFVVDQGLNVGLVLGEVKPDGMVDPKWQLILVEGEDVEIESEALLRELKLTERASEAFDLQIEDGKLFLSLKP